MSAAAVSSSLVISDQQAQQQQQQSTDLASNASIDIKQAKSPPPPSSESTTLSMMEQTTPTNNTSGSESSTAGENPSMPTVPATSHCSSSSSSSSSTTTITTRPSLPSSSSLNSSGESASELMMDFEDDEQSMPDREEAIGGEQQPANDDNNNNAQSSSQVNMTSLEITSTEHSVPPPLAPATTEERTSSATTSASTGAEKGHQQHSLTESTSADLSANNNINNSSSSSTKAISNSLLVTSSSAASSAASFSSSTSTTTTNTSEQLLNTVSQEFGTVSAPPALSRSSSLSESNHSSLVSASPAPPAQVLHRSNSTSLEHIKAEPPASPLLTNNTTRPTLPVIRSLSVGLQPPSTSERHTATPATPQSSATGNTTTSTTSSSSSVSVTTNQSTNGGLGMPNMLSTGQAPPPSTHQENIRVPPALHTNNSSNSHSASVVHPPPPTASHPMMDTYSHHHHHHSPGPHLGGLAPPGGGGGHHGGGHTPQTILSMSSPSLGGHSHPLSNVSVVTVASSSPSSDPKECIEEQCPVCGDRVSGYHYGLLTCESCKGFFKRTVQNKKVYTCVAERSCHIDKSQRKRCPYCRFQKCLEVGMKLEAVRADRMRGGRNKFGPMYKRDRARRLQILRQKQLTKAHHHLGGHGGGGHLGHHPPGATMLPGGELNFLQGGPHAHGGHGAGAGSGHHPTTLFDGVKQELIQIPQLSSSTSSPDSSPSPGSTAVQGGAQGGPLSAAAAAAAAAAVAAGHGAGSGHGGHPGPAGGNGGHHSFMPNLSISAHPMAQSNGGAANSGGLMNPAAAAAAAAADQLLKSWANGTAAGTSKTSMSVSPYGGGHEGGGSQGGPGPGSGTMAPGSKYLPPLVREFQSSMIDDKEWQAQLFGLLQNQTYNQCEVDLFELMCKVIDQSLFSQVDWARNSIFFKELKVDDQMKLLQHAWSDMLVLDHIHQRMHVGLPDDSTLPNGQKFDLLSLALLGVPQVVDQLHRVTARLAEIKVDPTDYICLKFLLLLNPEVRGLTNYKLVHEAHEQTKQALLEYTVNFYPQIADKFQQLLALVPEIRALTLRGEDFLYYKHINGSAPTQTLLMEMLHAKKK